MQHSTDTSNQDAIQAFERLLVMIAKQRGECPWCREQTMESLRSLVLEEAFELSEAVLGGAREEVKKELGDLLLHIMLYAQLAAEEQTFTLAEVMQALCEKLTHRNPHVYGPVEAPDAQIASQNWERRKLKEKGNQSILGGVPRALPSLIKANRILEKAQMVGLGRQEQAEAWQEIQAQLASLAEKSQEVPGTQTPRGEKQEELGELLWALVSYARRADLDPDKALERANRKFIKRVQHVEQQLAKQGQNIAYMSPQALQSYWEQAQAQVKNGDR